jgi:hypothetical protein
MHKSSKLLINHETLSYVRQCQHMHPSSPSNQVSVTVSNIRKAWLDYTDLYWLIQLVLRPLSFSCPSYRLITTWVTIIQITLNIHPCLPHNLDWTVVIFIISSCNSESACSRIFTVIQQSYENFISITDAWFITLAWLWNYTSLIHSGLWSYSLGVTWKHLRFSNVVQT